MGRGSRHPEFIDPDASGVTKSEESEMGVISSLISVLSYKRGSLRDTFRKLWRCGTFSVILSVAKNL